MWKILLKAVPVNLKRDIGTYILMGLLVAAGMYIASAFSGITYSYVVGGNEINRITNSEDGQFQIISPLSDQEERTLTQEGYILERAFYFDVDLDDGSTLRVMRTRQTIDKIILGDGTLPQTDSEAALEKCYAFHHDLHVSDTIRVADTDLRISGIGSVVDYDSPSAGMNDFSSDSITFGIVFVTDDCYHSMLDARGNNTREIYIYA